MRSARHRGPDGIGVDAVLVTCEHGGNRVPAAQAALFRGRQRVLATHRGFDPGALAMARDLARALDAPLVASTVSRLVVDLNRSLSNPRAWSEMTCALPPVTKAAIVARHYTPYRQQVAAFVAAATGAGQRLIHVSSHSFTPVLDGTVRTADIGLLYDPARPGERALATRWQAALAAQAPGLRVRRNYPYEGKNDGLTATLRKACTASQYVGIELEVSQRFVLAGGPPWRALRALVVATLSAALGSAPGPIPQFIPPPTPRSPQ